MDTLPPEINIFICNFLDDNTLKKMKSLSSNMYCISCDIIKKRTLKNINLLNKPEELKKNLIFLNSKNIYIINLLKSQKKLNNFDVLVYLMEYKIMVLTKEFKDLSKKIEDMKFRYSIEML